MPRCLTGAFALDPLALQLPGAADRGGPLTGALLRRLLIMTAQLHLAIDALTLQLLFERAQRLVDIVVANDDLHKSRPASFKTCPNSPGEPGARPGHPASISQGKEYCRPCPMARAEAAL